MKTSICIVVISVFGLSGCTTAGAPEPGQKSRQEICEDGMLKVCMGNVGSRIIVEKPNCTCN